MKINKTDFRKTILADIEEESDEEVECYSTEGDESEEEPELEDFVEQKKERFENGIVKTKNLAKEYSAKKFKVEADYEKKAGASTGKFLSSVSKKDPQVKKLWLNKKTIVNSALEVINSKTSTDQIFLTAFGSLISLLKLHKVRADDLESEYEPFEYELNSVDKDHSVLGSMRYEIIDYIKTNSAIKTAINNTILNELIGEALGGELNRLIDGNSEVPKARILHKSKDDSLSINSRISEGSQDLFAVFTEIHKGRIIDEPIKNLYQALIIRLFLGDNPRDFKLDNMVLYKSVDENQNRCWRVCNIDFGNAFTTDYKDFVAQGFTSESLFEKIANLSVQQGKYKIPIQEFLHKNLTQAEIDAEIEATFAKIANLKDEDLEFLVENLSTIKDNHHQPVISPAIQTAYLENIKQNRDVFAAAYQKMREKKNENFSECKEATIHTKTFADEENAATSSPKSAVKVIGVVPIEVFMEAIKSSHLSSPKPSPKLLPKKQETNSPISYYPLITFEIAASARI